MIASVAAAALLPGGGGAALARISQVNSALIEEGSSTQGLPCRCCAVVCGIEWGFIAASICCRSYSAPMHASLQGIIVRKADAKFVRIAFVAILVATGVCVRVVKSALECFTLYTKEAVLPWNAYDPGEMSVHPPTDDQEARGEEQGGRHRPLPTPLPCPLPPLQASRRVG